MKKYFLETSVIISYLRGELQAVKLIDNLEGELSSSYVCLAELYEGIFRVKTQEKMEKGVLDFFSGLSVIYGVDQETARNFGKLRKDLKAKGQMIEDMDILIAATCFAKDLALVTFNTRHFTRIESLQIYHP